MDNVSKVSFVIPVYNCGEYLLDCVEELKRVSAADYEIILVDDGSEDQSGVTCDRLSGGDRRIRCIHQENQGVSSARNRGLREATGDYICFFDADDEVEPEKLDRALKKLDSAGDADLLIFGMSFDYYHRKRIYHRYELSPALKGIADDEIWTEKLYDVYLSNSLSSSCNKIFRREFLIKNQLYFREDMFLYEDLEYSIRCMKHCGKILFEPEVIYHYRQSEDEGNSGRRLARIDHLYSLTDTIERALNELAAEKGLSDKQDEIMKIVLSLYLVLAREKIAISDKEQVRIICDDFADWYRKHAISFKVGDQKFVELLLNRQTGRLILKREYTKIRHRIAVSLKSTGVYRRLKG